MSTKIINLISVLSYFTRAFAIYLVYINSTFDFNGAIHYNLEMPFTTSIIVLVIVLDYIGFKFYKNRKSAKPEINYVLPDGFLNQQ